MSIHFDLYPRSIVNPRLMKYRNEPDYYRWHYQDTMCAVIRHLNGHWAAYVEVDPSDKQGKGCPESITFRGRAVTHLGSPHKGTNYLRFSKVGDDDLCPYYIGFHCLNHIKGEIGLFYPFELTIAFECPHDQETTLFYSEANKTSPFLHYVTFEEVVGRTQKLVDSIKD